jgi:hypothetical protein
MDNFKQYVESQSKHSDFFLAVSRDIKLDRQNSCKIWKDCGKRSTFRHVTDIDGMNFLLKNKDKNVTISALKHTKKLTKDIGGVETDGTITLIVDGDYEIWWPADAFSYVGQDGKRWISVGENNNFWSFFPSGFSDYLKDLWKIIEDYPPIESLIQTAYALDLDNEEGYAEWHYVRGLNVDTYWKMEGMTKEFVKKNKSMADRFTKEALALQVKYLDKYSEEIKAKLLLMWKEAGNKTIKFDLDEAIINNVQVKRVIFNRGVGDFEKLLSNAERFVRDYNEDSGQFKNEKEIRTQVEWITVPHLIKFIKSKPKQEFAFMGFGFDTAPYKKLLKKYPLGWNFIEKHFGITKSKGTYLKIK